MALFTPVGKPRDLTLCPATNPSVTKDPEARVNLSDAVFHTMPIKLGLREPCTKFTPPFNGAVGVGDAVFLTPYVKAGRLCNCQ